jgi:uncharacterized protein (TIGR00297 family)
MQKQPSLEKSSPPLAMVRKIIHTGIGVLILLLTWLIERDFLLWLIIGGSIFSFTTFRYKKFYLLHKTTHQSWGTLFYPVGILSAYLLLYDLPLYYFRSALMILTVSDTAANLIGKIKNGNGWFVLLGDKKSMHGMAGYLIATMVVLFALMPFPTLVNPFYILSILILALILELVSWRGSDNLSIPLGLALFFLWSERYNINYVWFSSVLGFMSAGGILMFQLKLLSRLGSLAAWMLGIYLLLLDGYEWIVVVLLFFITSVIFTKIRSKLMHNNRKDSGRNAWQVVANIIWAVVSSVIYLLTGNEFFIMLFIAFLGAVTADTWASELGPIFNKRSFSIADFRMKKAGVTGGISFAGTLAAALGALIVSWTGFLLFFNEPDWNIILLIALSAFLACFADTLLGAFVEDKMLIMTFFTSKKGKESLTPNDMVNLGGSLTAGFFLWLFI